MGRIITIPESRRRDWHLVPKTRAVERRATRATLPLPLTKTSKEAREVVFAASSCHLWISDRFARPTDRQYQGRVKKIQFRPNDILFIPDLEYTGARLFYKIREMEYFGFSKGAERVLLGQTSMDVAQNCAGPFINAIHAFPDLKELWIAENVNEGLYWNLHFYEPFAGPSILSAGEIQEMLGTVDIKALCGRQGRALLELKYIWFDKWFERFLTEKEDWPVDLSYRSDSINFQVPFKQFLSSKSVLSILCYCYVVWKYCTTGLLSYLQVS